MTAANPVTSSNEVLTRALKNNSSISNPSHINGDLFSPEQTPIPLRAKIQTAVKPENDAVETEKTLEQKMLEERPASEEQVSDENDQEIDAHILEKLNKLRQSADALSNTLRSINQVCDGDTSVTIPSKAEILEQTKATKEKAEEEDARLDFSNLRGKGIVDSVFDFAVQIFKQPDAFVNRYGKFAKELVDIVQSRSELQPERGDRRFRDAVWQDNPIYRIVLQTYLAWSRELQGLVEDLEYDDDTDQRRAKFLLDQLSAAIAPSNSPLNPVAVKRAYQTGGQSVLMGVQNLLRDIKLNGGMPRQVSDDVYKVGTDLGNTPGAVVYRSRAFEIIQYSSSDQEKVYQRPVLIVPPQINKFYIFDLTPKNSIVKNLLDNGHQTFIISWKNPTQQHASWGMETYVKELDKGMKAILDITKSKDLNLVSACAGGITSMATQAYQNKRGEKIVRNHSVLVTAFSADGHPTLDLFLNKDAVENTLARTKSKGVMEGKELAHVFAWLRPTELVWNYWVNNNLLGKEPPTMDVLFWDNDSTRLPASLHKDFIDILLNNRLASTQASTIKPFIIDGHEIDLSNLKGDFYFLAGDEDYLMPWKNCYKNLNLLPKANCEFVLSNSGHIQSVLRPPGIGNTQFYTNSNYELNAGDWLEQADEHKGSWWGHWMEWLNPKAGRTKKPPKTLGNHNYPPICASPGIYVSE